VRQSTPTIVVVTRQTRLEGLKHRWGTLPQAKFVLKQAHAHEDLLEQASPRSSKALQRSSAVHEEADFLAYEEEDAAYQEGLDALHKDLDFGLPIKLLDRSFLPSFDFWNCAAVVVVGQDGLVANTAKYVGELPIVGVNPDPERIDGVLLPFRVEQARRAVGHVLENNFRSRHATLARVELNDGQSLLAFNDFFVGASSHVSARYMLTAGTQSEPQSSSGVLVSTGAGSTGWLSSVFNMTAGVSQLLGFEVNGRIQLDMEDRRLVWAVREPFISKQS